MRIDKYLKITRIIKRRTIAKELLDRGIFMVNGRVAKPGTEIKAGDILTLPLGKHKLTVEVLNCLDYVKKNDANELYRILKDEIIETDGTEFK
jgi:Ribosome-associated heat shock protein implicated in the recycling of the 50S subunit (S4 paralog)